MSVTAPVGKTRVNIECSVNPVVGDMAGETHLSATVPRVLRQDLYEWEEGIDQERGS